MGKKLKHVTIWIIISLAIQFTTLYYINKNYLKAEASFETKKIEVRSAKKQEPLISIPPDAEKVRTSYDGDYISYCENNVIKVINTSNGQEKSVAASEGNKISMYRWLPDRHRIIMAEKSVSTRNGSIQLKYYDASKDIKDDIEKISWADSDTEVENIEVSPITNLIFVEIKRDDSTRDVYEVNAMNEVTKLKITSEIGNIKILPHEDELIYENKDDNKIETTNKNHSITFKDIQHPVILGADSNDNIYIGNIVNDKIDKIYYGSPQNSTEQWQVLNVTQPFNPKDSYISESGQIYFNNSSSGQVQELKSNKITSYEGVLLEMNEKIIISNNNGKLTKTIYK